MSLFLFMSVQFVYFIYSSISFVYLYCTIVSLNYNSILFSFELIYYLLLFTAQSTHIDHKVQIIKGFWKISFEFHKIHSIRDAFTDECMLQTNKPRQDDDDCLFNCVNTTYSAHVLTTCKYT